MNEEDINKIAHLVADIVLKGLAEKQKEWDKEFYAEFESLESGLKDPQPILDELEKLEVALKVAEDVRQTMLDREQYELLSEVDSELIVIKSKIAFLKNKRNNP
jgi:hypothetical protein